MRVLHADMKATCKNHNQGWVLVVFGSVCATGKRLYNQPMPRSRSATAGTVVLSHMEPHDLTAHEEATQLWFPSLPWPTQAQRFLNCAPLINSSKSTLGDGRVVFTTHVGSRHVVRKEKTHTQVYHNLSKCTPGETCVPVFHTKTGLLLLIRCCALKFFFQKTNKKPSPKKKSQEKWQVAVNMDLSVTCVTLCLHTLNIHSLQKEKKKKKCQEI